MRRPTLPWLACLLIITITQPVHSAESTSPHIKPVRFSEKMREALALNQFEEVSITFDQPSMLNVEVRLYGEDGKLDSFESRATWNLRSEGFDDHRVAMGFVDPSKLVPDASNAQIQMIHSEGPAVLLEPDWQVNGFGWYLPETIELDQDVKILFAQLQERRHTHRGDDGQLQPIREEDWQPRTRRIEMVVRVQLLDEPTYERFPFLLAPQSSTSYPYSPGRGDRFYPWGKNHLLLRSPSPSDGVSQTKLNRYGPQFLEVIQSHVDGSEQT